MKNWIWMILTIILMSSCSKMKANITRNIILETCFQHRGVSFVKMGAHSYYKITCIDGTIFDGNLGNLKVVKKGSCENLRSLIEKCTESPDMCHGFSILTSKESREEIKVKCGF